MDPSVPAPSAKRGAAPFVVIGALICLFFILASVGARQAEEGTRVLTQLDGIFAATSGPGAQLYDWANGHASVLAFCTTFVAGLLVALSVIVSGRQAGPVVLLAASVCFVAWGQANLLADEIESGIVLYGLGVACATGLGIWKPLTPGAADSLASSQTSVADWTAIFVLTAFAMSTRLYALNELPNAFDVEITEITLHSLTLHGVREWAAVGFFTNSAGIAHFFPQWAMALLYGASLYSVRLAAVFCGVVSVPLFYILVHRLVGTSAAIFGTLLFVTSPEQLYWSRLETTVYIPLSVLSVVTVLFGFSLIERPTWKVGTATAVCMGIARVFYQAGIVMVFHPLLLWGHAMVFRRSARRMARRVLPFLMLGVALWISSISMMRAAAGGGLTLLNPFVISGNAPWTKQGEYGHAAPLELVRLQALSIGMNLTRVAQSMSYRAAFSRWYDRGDRSSHPTIMNVALFACLTLGLGYLLGQLRDPRAWALLTWIGLGLAPGVLSLDSDARRIALIFPALPIVVTLFATAALRLVRTHAGRLAGTAMVIVTAVLGVAIGITNLVSHFLLPAEPLHLAKLIAAARPVLMDSHVVLYDQARDVAAPLVLGNLDLFTERTPPVCIRSLVDDEPLSVTLRPTCDFSSFLHRSTLSPQRIVAAREHYVPERFTYLLTLAPHSRHLSDLLREIYPSAKRRIFQGAFEELSFEAVTVSSTEIEAAHRPRIRVATGVAESERIVTSSAPFEIDSSRPTAAGAVIEAGFVAERDEWWSIALTPPCPGAVIKVDDQVTSADGMQALHAGVHTSSIHLPNPSRCALPLRVTAVEPEKPDRDLFGPGVVLAPDIAARLRASALPVGLYPGYRKIEDIVVPSTFGDPVDVAAGRDNLLTVAFKNSAGVVFRRIDPDRSLDQNWSISLPADFGFQSLKIADDGSVVALGNAQVFVYDRSARETASWPYPAAVVTPGAFDPAGTLLLSWPQEGAVARINLGGSIEETWHSLPGGPQRFDLPVAVASSPSGGLAIIQVDGRVFRYRRLRPTMQLELAASFQAASSGRVHRFGIAADDRIFIQAAPGGTIHVYSSDGRRLLAFDRELDLGNAVPSVRSFEDTGDRLLVLGETGIISVFAPLRAR